MIINNIGFTIMIKNQDVLDIFSPLSSEKIDLLNSLITGLSRSQLSWLSGYFWNLGNSKSNILNNKKIDVHNNLIITIVSASQTGNAKGLADILLEDCIKNNINARLFNASDYPFKKINQEKILIFIISTHGEGEPPEEAIELYNFLISNRILNLKNIYFSVFGLGDKSYNLFCQAAKNLDNKLLELGGERLLDRVDADLDYLDQAKKWRKNLLNKIKIFIKKKIPVSSNNIVNYTNSLNNIVLYTKDHPATCTILNNQKITGRNSKKNIRHIEISLKNMNINYSPGDALGVFYENSAILVEELLNLLNIKFDDIIIFKNNKISIKEALQKYYELTVNTISTLKKYMKFTNSVFLNSIKNNNQKMFNYVKNTPIIDMIYNIKPYKQITATELLTLFRLLSPRLYSISSSQSDIYDEVHITVRVVKYLVNNKLRFGGASGYLSNSFNKNNKIKCFIVQNNNFRLPHDDNSIIMIGAGTGIAPFRSFMQQRVYNQASGKNWIFFGNTNFTEDFLYQIEWQRYFKQGLLHKIDLAWSQDYAHKIYVQDKIKENGLEVWNWIKNGAYIYICGDSKNMAPAVELAFLDIFLKFGNMNIESSKIFLNTLRAKKRYQRDIY